MTESAGSEMAAALAEERLACGSPTLSPGDEPAGRPNTQVRQMSGSGVAEEVGQQQVRVGLRKEGCG
jgi:hypothetical protein